VVVLFAGPASEQPPQPPLLPCQLLNVQAGSCRARATAGHGPTFSRFPFHTACCCAAAAGAFGVVRLAVHVRTGLRYAVKTVLKAQLRRRVDVEDLTREVTILSQLSSHPNVAALLHTYEDEAACHIVLELVSGGSWRGMGFMGRVWVREEGGGLWQRRAAEPAVHIRGGGKAIVLELVRGGSSVTAQKPGNWGCRGLSGPAAAPCTA
jgi:hypothetical protein